MSQIPAFKALSAAKHAITLGIMIILLPATASPLLAAGEVRNAWVSIGLTDQNAPSFSLGARVPDSPIGFELAGPATLSISISITTPVPITIIRSSTLIR